MWISSNKFLEPENKKLEDFLLNQITDWSRQLHRYFVIWKKEARLLDFFSGVAVGVCVSSIFTHHIWPNRHLTRIWMYSSRFRKHWKAGLCCHADLVLRRDGYAVGYSFLFRSPLWVSYIACRGSIGLNMPNEGAQFMTDSDIPKEFQTKPTDYLLTGYDRGHMASRSIIFSSRSSDQTMLLSNVCLQHPELNRNGWKSLESNIRRWISLRGKHAVVVGPLWESEQVKKINSIAIPKSFFLAVYSYSTGEAIAFHVPNKPVDAREIWNYVVTVDELERVAKCRIFRNLPYFRRPKTYRRRKVSMEFWRKL